MNRDSLHIANENFLKKHQLRDDWMEDLQGYEQNQFTFKNPTDQLQKRRIWNEEGAVKEDKEGKLVAGGYPIKALWNSFNKRLYVINLLSNDLWIYNQLGEFQRKIALEENPFTSVAPVAMCLDETKGLVYIAGSISNTIYVVDQNLKLQKKLLVSSRPFSLAINTAGTELYIAHLYLHQISVIDLVSEELLRVIEVGNDPVQVVFLQERGQLLCLYLKEAKIDFYLTTGQLQASILLQGQAIKAAISEDEAHLYVIVSSENQVLKYSLATTELLRQEALAREAKDIIVLEEDRLALLIKGEGIKEYSSDLEFLQEIKESNEAGQLLYFKEKKVLLYTLPLRGRLSWLNRSNEGISIVAASSGYEEAVKEFKSQAILLKHTKITYSGSIEAPVLRIGSRTPSGKLNSKVISLSRYQSPQHFIQQFEVFEIENEIIDGRSFWEIGIPPEGEVSMMLYYR